MSNATLRIAFTTLGIMPRNSFEWDAIDDEASRRIDGIIADANLNNTSLARASGDKIKYNRVRDIRMWLKAPMRLSEFVTICRACHVDPVEVFSEIISAADARDGHAEKDVLSDAARQQLVMEHLKAAMDLAGGGDGLDDDKRKALALKHMQSGLALAAYESEHKDAYIEGDAA